MLASALIVRLALLLFGDLPLLDRVAPWSAFEGALYAVVINALLIVAITRGRGWARLPYAAIFFFDLALFADSYRGFDDWYYVERPFTHAGTLIRSALQSLGVVFLYLPSSGRWYRKAKVLRAATKRMESDLGVFDRELAKLAQIPIAEIFAYPESEDLSHLMDGAKTSLRRYRESQDDGSVLIVYHYYRPRLLGTGTVRAAGYRFDTDSTYSRLKDEELRGYI